MEADKKSGFVTLIGRPNVGKSTLMNRLIGQKIAITSNKPQTTRNKIQTVYTCEQGQIVFLDTPGIHKEAMKNVANFGKKEKNPAFFSKDYPVKDVVSMCVYQGKPYMTAEFLNGDKAYSVPKKDAKEIKAALAAYVKAVPNAKLDTSIDTMALRDGTMHIVKSANRQPNTVAAALKQNGGR